jgi:cytoskeletal protein CcmA (bactofilin family)
MAQNYVPGYDYMFNCSIHPNGRYLYQTTSSNSNTPNRILVHDIKNPSNITTTAAIATGGSFSTPGSANLLIVGQVMWVQTSSNNSTQYSITNPANPVSTGATYTTYGIQQIVGQTFYSLTGSSNSSSVQIRTSQGIAGSQVDFGSMYAHQALVGNSGLEVLGSADIKGGLTTRRSATFGSNVAVNGKVTMKSASIKGSFSVAVLSITGAATLNDTHSVVLCGGTSSYQVTLPTAVGIAGRMYQIKKTSISDYTLTIGTTSSQTIDGSTSLGFSTQYNNFVVISDGANWSLL